ncbi:MAG: 50S ribosomal protein L15 [Rhodospirillaceae bacterium]|nr:MAG: 50S ribosomal protein L15 [Rhodospirillaceae bacterium]
MKLNEISNRPGACHARKRVGRGIGSGTGKTSGRGHKGQKARTGVALHAFEGGQMPIYRRLPRRGFWNPGRKHYQLVNLGRLQQAIDAGKLDSKKPITEAVLYAAGLVGRIQDGVRLLAKGEITAQLTIEVTGASKAAITAVEKTGGKVIVTAVVVDRQAKAKTGKKAVDSGEG